MGTTNKVPREEPLHPTMIGPSCPFLLLRSVLKWPKTSPIWLANQDDAIPFSLEMILVICPWVWGQQLKNWVPVAKRFGTVARWQCMAMVSRKTLLFVCWRIIYRWTLKETCDISCKMVELDMANREIQIWVGQSYTITRLLCDISDDYYTTWWFPKMGVPPNHPF